MTILASLLFLALAVATPPMEESMTISQFFSNLYTTIIAPSLYMMAVVFIGIGAIGLMLPGGRSGERAKEHLVHVLAGLAIGLLATAIASGIKAAAGVK